MFALPAALLLIGETETQEERELVCLAVQPSVAVLNAIQFNALNVELVFFSLSTMA